MTIIKVSTKLAAVILFLAMCVSSYGQGSTATITGTVKDPQGAIVPGATVTVTQTETNFSQKVKTANSGEFSLGNLPVGPYRVRIEMTGFASFEQQGIVLQVGQVANLPVALTVGAQTDTVEVTGEASAVETTDNAVQSVIGQKVVEGLPLNGRNPADLVNTVAGVTNVSLNIDSTNFAAATTNYYKQPTSTIASESVISTHGVRPGGTYFSLDGASNVDPYSVIGGPFPNPDATQEFNVVTGSYGAQYVSAPGGAVNIVTRSGTNDVHGTVFEFIRNGFFNAENAVLAIPDPLKRNQYGATLGGPILKNKVFLFGAFQETDISTANAFSNFVPSAAERNGMFTSLITGLPVQVPISPATANLLKFIPLANRPTGAFVESVGTKSKDHQGTLKADLTLGQHRFFARYFGDYLNQPAVGMVGNDAFHRYAGQVRNWYSVAGGDTWASKSGHWLSNTTVSYASATINNTSPATDSMLSPTALGMNGITVDNGGGIGVFASFSISAFNNTTQIPRTNLNFTEDATHIVGNHELSFGGDFNRIQLTLNDTTGRNPAFAFEGINSLIQYGPLNDNTNADLLLGAPLLLSQEDGFFATPRGKLFGVYGQDRYRVTDKLTLIGGLRWDPFFPYPQQGNRLTCFVPGEQSTVFTNASKGLVFPGDSNCQPGGATNKYNVVEPRVGFAYQLDKKGSLALRGGYGIYAVQLPLNVYEGFNDAPYTRQLVEIQPFLSWDNVYASAGIANPFAGGFHGSSYNPPSTIAFPSFAYVISTFDKGVRPGTTQQYSLSLQQAFTSKDSMELAYVGTLSTNLTNTADANLPVPSSTATAATVQARRPYQAFSQIIDIRSDSRGSYNGLDLTVRHQSPKGLSATSAFNWSKCIDEATQSGTTSAILEHGNSPRLTRGRCDFDQNLTWRTIGVWNLPSLEGSNAAIKYALGSWSTSGIFTLDAGQPFTVTAADNSNSGLNTDYADRIPGVPLYDNGILNYNAFTQNAMNTYGNSGRNSFRSKRYVDLDMGLQKNFPITKRVNTTFRAETFNLFNHANYYGINSSYTNSTAQNFGVYTESHDPRIMQFSLKVLF